jgi:hypothetical protein
MQIKKNKIIFYSNRFLLIRESFSNESRVDPLLSTIIANKGKISFISQLKSNEERKKKRKRTQKRIRKNKTN